MSFTNARIERQDGRLLLTHALLPVGDIRRGQLWVAADGSGLVAIIDSTHGQTVFYTINGQAFSKDAAHFQARYCLSILGN